MTRDWIWDGGRPCLDLVNTLRERWTDHPRELLVGHADLADWLAATGLADAPSLPPELLHRARELREAVDHLLCSAEQPRRADVELVDRWAQQSGHRPPRLLLDRAGRLQLEPPPAVTGAEWALAIIAADAVALLADDEQGRVGICAHARCGLRFLDRSPARNRHWCSMRPCGNRVKAQQHYARKAPRTREAV